VNCCFNIQPVQIHGFGLGGEKKKKIHEKGIEFGPLKKLHISYNFLFYFLTAPKPNPKSTSPLISVHTRISNIA
jgi:hypothetical protein